MHSRRKGYSSLDELYSERDAIPWYWRIAALAASWLILGGYLVLPSTFDTDPHLRFSKGGVDAIIAIFLVAGYALTILLYFVVPSWLFRAESIFYPALCSSAFGLIGTLYAFASSPRYKFNTPAGITIALTSCSTAAFAVLLVLVQRKIARVRAGATTYDAGAGITIVEDIPQDGRESQSSTAGLYQDPNYYRNYIANMHPSAIRTPSLHDDHRSTPFDTLHERPSYQTLREPSPSPPGSRGAYYDPPPPLQQHSNLSTPDLAAQQPSPFLAPQIGEEEQVSQHLARLLLNTRDGDGQGPNASQTTFRIDWRSEDDEDGSGNGTGSSSQGIQLRARTGSGSRLVPPGKLAQVAAAAVAARPSPPLARLAPYRGGEASRARSRDAGGGGGGGHKRGKSRDDRRKEIELGFVGFPPPPPPPPPSGGTRR